MNTLEACEQALTERFDCALLDLDGVVYRGEDAVPHAVGAISAAREGGMHTMFVTNNASRSPQTVADHLTDLGIPTGAEEVTTAAMAAATLVASEADGDTRVLVVGGPGMHEALRAEGLQVVASADDNPTIVVQGFDPSVGWSDLAEAAYAIGRGAVHIASNIDATLPTERGFAPGNGSLVAAVQRATGVAPRSTGKPEPEIFRDAARRAGGTEPLVIGDRLNTDLAGARAAEMPGLHVFTGVDGPTEVLRAVPAHRPTFLAADLRGLATEHPAPVSDGQWWRCGDAAATLRHSGLVLRLAGVERSIGEGDQRPDPVTLDELRAACAACWTASDAAGADSVLGDDFPQLTLTET